MTKEELCTCACKYAIGELTRKGSTAFITSAHAGRQQISWVEVVEWLKDYKQEIYEKAYKEGYDKGWSDGNFIGANRRILSEDAVSRQAVLNTLDKRFDSIPVGQTTEILLLRKDLRELPPVTPPGWITVSERIPKPNETEHMIAKYYLVQNEYGDMMVARWDGKGWNQMYQPNSYLEDDVIAWMPLPSPYELQESEED